MKSSHKKRLEEISNEQYESWLATKCSGISAREACKVGFKEALSLARKENKENEVKLKSYIMELESKLNINQK